MDYGRLSAVLSEFARTLVTDFPIQGILDHLVMRIVEVMPVDAAGVTLIEPGKDPRYVAASDESALRFERLQSELSEGPCVVAYTTGEAVAVADLTGDVRFPTFAKRAREEGLAAVFTFPLRQDDHQLGALDLYCNTAGLLDEPTMVAAQTLADVACAYILNAYARAELRESSDRARESSLHDPLTGLPNRSLLVERLEHAILRCRRSGKLVAVLFADLDRFKPVNDTYGHHVGDQLLVAVAKRLSGVLRPGDSLARMAGDEFVILCEDLDDAHQAEVLAERVAAALSEAFAVATMELRISASIGIAFAGRGDEVPHQLLQDADKAMYEAKRRGGGQHGIIDLREPGARSAERDLYADLPGALNRGELASAYQPIIGVADNAIRGVEALLRWNHPTLGTVQPDVTIPLAEQLGLMGAIGRATLERACADRQRWHSSVAPVPDLYLNVSPNELMSPGYTENVARVLGDTGTDPRHVTLEVTENVFIQDDDRALMVLEDLKRLGVMLALDDFGTGYSSLVYLKRFPIDVVKIDRVFVSDLELDPTSRLIVGAVIGLAHGLGMRVVAEGVETAHQYGEVLSLRCDAFQGFYSSRPMSAESIGAMVAEARPESA